MGMGICTELPKDLRVWLGTMLEYREEQSLVELAALASQANMGAKFRVFTRALPSTIIPDSMGAYTFKGCNHYIARTRQFCKRLVGVRRGLFAENATKKSHAGPCSVEGTHFYRFIVELQDGSGRVFAVIGDSAAYLLGTSLPFPAHEFVTLGPRSKANLFSTVSVREFYFHLQFTMSHKGVGSWSILKCSNFPLHTLITPYQSPANSGPSPEAQTESSRVPGVLLVPDGSPLTRLLDIQPRRNPLNGLPAETWAPTDRRHLVFALHMLEFVSLALKQAATLVDSVIQKIVAYLEDDREH